MGRDQRHHCHRKIPRSALPGAAHAGDGNQPAPSGSRNDGQPLPTTHHYDDPALAGSIVGSHALAQVLPDGEQNTLVGESPAQTRPVPASQSLAARAKQAAAFSWHHPAHLGRDGAHQLAGFAIPGDQSGLGCSASGAHPGIYWRSTRAHARQSRSLRLLCPAGAHPLCSPK